MILTFRVTDKEGDLQPGVELFSFHSREGRRGEGLNEVWKVR